MCKRSRHRRLVLSSNTAGSERKGEKNPHILDKVFGKEMMSVGLFRRVHVWNLALKKGTFCEWEFRCGSSEVFTFEKNNLPESPRVLPTLIQPSRWEETHLRKPQSFHDAFSPPSPPFSSPLLHALVNLCRKLNALSSHYFCSVCFCRLCAAAWPWRLRKNEAVTFLSSHNLFS